MNGRTGKSINPKVLLWWVAIIALAVSGAMYYFLGEQAKIDVALRQKRLLFPMVGVVIAGICFIAGTSSRWFYPK